MTIQTADQASGGGTAGRHIWRFSWPLLSAVGAFLFGVLAGGSKLLGDGDTYWHIAAGRWILTQRTIPNRDPFSHTMPGAVWTAHEWLSEVLLATVHDWFGWTAVAALASLALAWAIALLTRHLLRSLEPVYALMFAAFAVALTAGHLLARPHILATPLLVAWMIGLVRAREEKRRPTLSMLPLMVVWANLHGSFTLGLALMIAFAGDALFTAWRTGRWKEVAKPWLAFVALAIGCSMITPHGAEGLRYTWQIFVESRYALQQIGEWRSPNFQEFHALEVWLLAGLGLFLLKGFRLEPFLLLLLLGFLHMALKHQRYVELLGLIVPVFLARPLAIFWQENRKNQEQAEAIDRIFNQLARPAGKGAILVCAGAVLITTLLLTRLRPIDAPEAAAPARALEAVRAASIRGNVLNNYGLGGYLIYSGIPVFIDGRAEMYGDAFLKAYIDALSMSTSDGFEKLLDKYRIEWTLLTPGATPVAMLDHLPGWRRLYSDKAAVVHVRERTDRP